jgi:hypothetical protein
MFGSLMRGVFFLSTLLIRIILFTADDGDNRGTIDPNG